MFLTCVTCNSKCLSPVIGAAQMELHQNCSFRHHLIDALKNYSAMLQILHNIFIHSFTSTAPLLGVFFFIEFCSV